MITLYALRVIALGMIHGPGSARAGHSRSNTQRNAPNVAANLPYAATATRTALSETSFNLTQPGLVCESLEGLAHRVAP